jgi:hypothetical protein
MTTGEVILKRRLDRLENAFTALLNSLDSNEFVGANPITGGVAANAREAMRETLGE